MITISLPIQFKIGTMYEFLKPLLGPDRQPIHNQVVFDFSGLEWIDGGGMTVMRNTLDWLGKRGVKCGFINHMGQTKPLQYMDDCGFFVSYLGSPVSTNAMLRETTLPLTQIKHAESHSWIEFTAAPWMAKVLGISVDSFGEIRTCIKEIFNNIDDHSEEEIGNVHTQFYPNKKEMELTISDFGCGIPVCLGRRRGPFSSDADAILEATKDGVTSKSVTGNCGAGLGILIDYIVLRNGGRVDIRSGAGALNCRRQGRGVRKAPWTGSGFYPGTLIHIVMRTDVIQVQNNERGDLVWS